MSRRRTKHVDKSLSIYSSSSPLKSLNNFCYSAASDASYVQCGGASAAAEARPKQSTNLRFQRKHGHMYIM